MKNIFKTGDILFGKLRPYLRKYWFAKFDGVCSSEVWVFNSCNRRCLNDYLFYLIQSDLFIQISNVASGSKMPRADWDYISNLPFVLPPLPEQQKIAEILSVWDRAIDAQTQLIASLQTRKRALMQQFLTGKKRLKGFSGEWKKCHIKDIANEISIRNTKNKDIVVLSCTKYDGLVLSLEYFGRKIFSNDVSTYKIVPINHFAYATNHIEEGSIGYQTIYKEALISPMYTVFKTDNCAMNDQFLFMLLKSHSMLYQYNARMEGSIDRRGGLRWSSFSNIKIKIPPLTEQTAIAEILSAADKEIAFAQEKLAKMKEQKKGLMQVLLTGKRRVEKRK
jgi:type I restriction enzyme S subunit